MKRVAIVFLVLFTIFSCSDDSGDQASGGTITFSVNGETKTFLTPFADSGFGYDDITGTWSCLWYENYLSGDRIYLSMPSINVGTYYLNSLGTTIIYTTTQTYMGTSLASDYISITSKTADRVTGTFSGHIQHWVSGTFYGDVYSITGSFDSIIEPNTL